MSSDSGRIPAFLRASPSWFWAAILLGAALRAYFVFFTEGTLDVGVWHTHGHELNRKGLIGYYHGGIHQFNHPPPIGMLIAKLWVWGHRLDIPFAVLLRLPFALLDLGSVLLILSLLAEHRHRFALAALYWLHPLAILFSSYHGNTDSAVAFFLLASLLAVLRDKPLLAGAILGFSFWIKLPGVLAAPALALALPLWQSRARFAGAVAIAGLAGYLPALLLDHRVVIDSVVLYPGLTIHTSEGVVVWGLQNFYPAVESLPGFLRLPFIDLKDALRDHNTLVCVAPIVVLAWCRREKREVREIAFTIAAGYALLYGLTQNWAFQYLAWSVPFWVLSGWGFGIGASAVATLYVYPLYAWLCSSPFLLGAWDFLGKPTWPGWLLALRNVANLFFLVAGLAALVRAVWDRMPQRGAGPTVEGEAGAD